MGCFNVAATLELRKEPQHNKENQKGHALQCGRNFRVAEGRKAAKSARSIGLLQCGRNFRVAEGVVGRARRRLPGHCFNVAATLELRKEPNDSDEAAVGRGFNVAATLELRKGDRRGPLQAVRRTASMWPQL